MTPTPPITSVGLNCVLLADRHYALSEGVRGLLETHFAVVVTVADETSLIEGARRLRPSMAVADLSLPRSDGLEWMSELKRESPELKVIVLSVHDEPSVCRSALAAGVNGFVLKRDIGAELMDAVATAAAGKRYVSTGALKKMPPAERAIYEHSTT